MEDMSAATATRARRFQRRDDPPAFQLTARDIALLQHVARHRFLSSKHLAALDGGSEQNLLRCLRVLFDNGYLDRPSAQLAHVPVVGPRPMVYGLGRRGARVLQEHHQRESEATDWTERNKRAGAKFIEHTIAIAHFMVGLELGCRGRTDLELLRESEIIARASDRTRHAREPLRLAVPGLDNSLGVSSVVADGLFGLVFPDETASYFLLEIDRGSMPLTRSRFDQTSIKRKLAIYWEGWKQGRPAEHFGIKQVRVLTVTDSAERADRMVQLVFDLTGGRGSNFFLFAEQARFYGRSPLDVWWTTGKGQLVRLTD
jgi:hypothetical protein